MKMMRWTLSPVAALLVVCLLLSASPTAWQLNAGSNSCWVTPTVFSSNSSCSCRFVGVTPISGYYDCGAGHVKNQFVTCRRGSQGFQDCDSRLKRVGSAWTCDTRLNWVKYNSCLAATAACTLLCQNPAKRAECAVCSAGLIANCVGCSIRYCSTGNVTPLYGLVRQYTAGSCNSMGNTGN